MKVKFTKTFLDSPLPPGNYTDADQAGLNLVVTKYSKTYYARCKMPSGPDAGKAIKVFIGKTDNVSLPDAKEQAGKYVDDIKSGFNPNEAKRDASALESKEQLLRYLAWCVARLGGKIHITARELQKDITVELIDSEGGVTLMNKRRKP